MEKKAVSRIIMIISLVLSSFTVFFLPEFLPEASGFDVGYTFSWPMFRCSSRRMGFTKSPVPLTNTTIWVHTLNECISLSSPAVANGRVFIGGYREVAGSYLPSRVWALNATDGTIVWDYETGSVVMSSPAVADGMVFVGSWDGYVYALNETTGLQVWNFSAGGSVMSSPAIDHMSGVPNPDRVFVGSINGSLYALNEYNGSLNGTVRLVAQ